MRIALVPSIPVGSAVDADCIFYADVTRGATPTATIDIEVDEHRAHITGAELRAALLSAVHTGPWKLGSIGAGRFALRLDPEDRCSTLAHLDSQGLGNPRYWLYRRGDNGIVLLTRWSRAGYISRTSLLQQAGVSTESISIAAHNRQLTRIVAEGLPRALRLRSLHPAASLSSVEAANPGWLDIPPGALKVEPDRIPVHQVDDLGEWPSEAS